MNGNWRRLAVVISGVLVATALLAIVLQPRESTYQGKRLSKWINRTNFGLDQVFVSQGITMILGEPRNHQQVQTALREIGTNAIPFLLAKAKSKDGLRPVERIYLAAWSKLPNRVRKQLPSPTLPDNVFPFRIASALSLFGPAALPTLISVLQNSDRDLRLAALRAVIQVGTETDSMTALTPLLARFMNDPDREIRIVAALALDQTCSHESPFSMVAGSKDSGIKPRTGMVVGSLTENGRYLLGGIGPGDEVSAATFTRLLNYRQTPVRTEAAIALWRLHHNTNGIPVLSDELGRSADRETRARILRVLGEMGLAGYAAAPGN
jgi:HEAT repeats